MLFLANLKWKERPFLELERMGATFLDYPQEHLVVTRDEKVFRFVKFEIIKIHLCFLLDPLTNKHYKT